MIVEWKNVLIYQPINYYKIKLASEIKRQRHTPGAYRRFDFKTIIISDQKL